MHAQPMHGISGGWQKLTGRTVFADGGFLSVIGKAVFIRQVSAN